MMIFDKTKFKEVNFRDGLYYISRHPEKKLYSNILDYGEYIKFVDDHYEYEDNTFLGRDSYDIIKRTGDTLINSKLYTDADIIIEPGCKVHYVEKGERRNLIAVHHEVSELSDFWICVDPKSGRNGVCNIYYCTVKDLGMGGFEI